MADAGDVADRLERFRGDLLALTESRMVQRHIIYGSCFAIGEEEHFDLKVAVADHFDLNPQEVVVVGSGKLGFSIAPEKRWTPFGDHSDIDVALTSERLFDGIWEEAFRFAQAGGDWGSLAEFRKYHFRGWMRPQALPPAESIPTARNWWEFFRELTASGKFGPYPINGALYRRWLFLETYQAQSIRSCRLELEGNQ